MEKILTAYAGDDKRIFAVIGEAEKIDNFRENIFNLKEPWLKLDPSKTEGEVFINKYAIVKVEIADYKEPKKINLDNVQLVV